MRGGVPKQAPNLLQTDNIHEHSLRALPSDIRAQEEPGQFRSGGKTIHNDDIEIKKIPFGVQEDEGGGKFE